MDDWSVDSWSDNKIDWTLLEILENGVATTPPN